MIAEIEDPVEILVGMAKKGEIDPWNIDVVDVTDKFLKKLEEMKKLDLRISGRVLLYASMLVRLKSEVLVEDENDEDDFEEFFHFTDEPELEITEEVEELPPPSCSRKIKRHTTLDELVKELKRAEIVEKRRRERRKLKDRQRSKEFRRTMHIPHEEFIEETMYRVERKLLSLMNGREYITFSQLLRGNGADPVSIYISLLYLAFRKKISLRQERMYGELEIWWSGNGRAGD